MNTVCLKTARWAAVLTAAASLAGCGGGGGGAGAPVPNDAPATVGVLLTDAPTTQWDQAIATITSVSLIGNGGPVTIFSGSRTLDLLQLGDFSELFAVSDTVPPGQYSKIRLQVSSLVLNDLDPTTGAVIDSVDADLVGNGKIDLNPQQPFTVGPAAVLFVELDFDMEKSLKIVETGSGKFIVRPVVFVNIHTNRPGGRLSRIHGEINEVDAAAGTLLLCQTDFASRWDDHVTPHAGTGGEARASGAVDPPPSFGADHCVTVTTDGATGIFGSDGLPQDFTGLAVGEEATVIGRLRRLEVQPVTGVEHPFAFDAFVIEEGALGAFRRIGGTAVSPVDAVTARFGLDVAPGQGIATDTPLPVQLFDHSRIFNRLGQELGRDDIQPGRRALADGVLQIGAEDLLRSPLVMLADAQPAGEAALEGTIASVDTMAVSLIVSTDTSDRCVDAANAEIFLVTTTDGFSSSRGEIGDLAPGQNVSIFGVEGTGGCLIADTILAER